MQTIRYSKNNLEFANELRKKVKEYFSTNKISPYGNGQILIKTVFMGFVYFGPYFLMISGTTSSVFHLLICYFLMGLGMTGLGMITMHDANHGSFSKNQKVNNLFGNTLYLLGGFPPNWRFQHNTLHHGYTNVDGHDEDIAPVGILRFSPHKPIKGIHRFQYLYAWFFYSLMTISWITLKDFKGIVKYYKMNAVLSNSKSFGRLLTELIFSKMLYYSLFLLLPILFSTLAWPWVVFGFVIMHLTSGIILSIIFQTAHVVPTSNYPLPSENNELEHNWMVHQLYTTSDFSPKSRIFSWFIGGLNYQVVHHLFPNISHIHYKKLAPIVMATAEKYGLPYYVNSNFAIAIAQHLRMLKELGRKSTERKRQFNLIKVKNPTVI